MRRSIGKRKREEAESKIESPRHVKQRGASNDLRCSMSRFSMQEQSDRKKDVEIQIF